MAKGNKGKGNKAVEVVDVPVDVATVAEVVEAPAEETPMADWKAGLRDGFRQAGATHHYQTNGVCYAGGIVRDEEEGSITVLPGSRLVGAIPTSNSEATEKTLTNGRNYRARLVADEVIGQDGGGWVFLRRHTFPSRSTAATVIGGVVVNGKTAWRDIGDDFGRKAKAPPTREEAIAEIGALMAKWGLTAADIG